MEALVNKLKHATCGSDDHKSDINASHNVSKISGGSHKPYSLKMA